MKKLSIVLVILFTTAGLFAQSPQRMSYQAVVRDAANKLVVSKIVGIRISILQGSVTGTVVYSETQTPSTNSNGMVTLEIGGGAGFDAINWANGTYFIKTETDPTGGTSYTITGTSQLLSVPYALYAKKAENGFSGAYSDLTGKPDLWDSSWSSIKDRPNTIDGYEIIDAVKTSGNQTINGNKTFSGTTSVAAPVNPTDAVTKAYVDVLKANLEVMEDMIIEAGLYRIKDVDGNAYNTIKIGKQVWMKENLRVTKYSDGTPIPMVTDNARWDTLKLTDRAYTYYDNDSTYAVEWGAFYTWATVTNGDSSNTNPSHIQGICPDGWHIPSDAEWQELEMVLGMPSTDTGLTGIARGADEGGKLKESGFGHFMSPNTGASNETGFTALPAGNRTYNIAASFDNLNKYGNFWTSTKVNGSPFIRILYYQYSSIGRVQDDIRSGLSCRCLKD